MTEQQIKEEILRYLKDDSYNYAVLIDGEWGSGKTYFVKNTLAKAINEQEVTTKTQRTMKYISLYGCKSIVDVQENIAWSFAENAREKIKNKKKWGETGDKLSGNILLLSKKIGNLIMEKLLPEGSVYEIASDWLNLGSFIFVFDDLERCDCPINEIFGFLNELVEHENTKVIIVANEKEISGIADTEYLELQYQLTLDDRIEWPKREDRTTWYSYQSNKKLIPLDEMERRRELLFPSREANSDYKRVREKLIGVTLKYNPDVTSIIGEIIEASSSSENVKKLLRMKKEDYSSTMQYYNHRNLRTFQFFLSKANYLLERLADFSVEDDYYEKISNHIISEAFSQAVKFKSNFQPSRDNYTWLRIEQETGLQSVKNYIERGTFDGYEYEQEVMKLQDELKAQIPNDDPYYQIYQQYYLHTQDWCEQQLEKVLNQLGNNRYPVSLYGKIIVAIQRLVDLGFDECYMERAKTIMLSNISSMGEVVEVDSDIWYVDDPKFKNEIEAIINDINAAIKNHTEIASRENVKDILKHEDWIDRLMNYVNPNSLRYVNDISVFGKAPSEDWLSNLYSASPEEIDSFRHLLSLIYPRNTKRNSYSGDATVIHEIIVALKNHEETDLIKKACTGWLLNQYEMIVEQHEPLSGHTEKSTNIEN